jgi:beta-phosphoglucomutase
MEPYAVIWDMDGTLVDTAELHFRAWAELAAELGRAFTRADFAATFGLRNPEIIPKLWGNQFTPEQIANLGDRKEEKYRAAARQGVTLLPGVRPLLEQLHQEGFRQGVGSSAPRANLALILDLTRTRAYFAAVVAMEDTQRGKPDPEVFLTAASRLGVQPGRCLVLEDAPAGVQAARAGGMKCIAVNFVGHHPADALRAAGANRVVDSLEQVSAVTVHRLLSGVESSETFPQD